MGYQQSNAKVQKKIRNRGKTTQKKTIYVIINGCEHTCFLSRTMGSHLQDQFLFQVKSSFYSECFNFSFIILSQMIKTDAVLAFRNNTL